MFHTTVIIPTLGLASSILEQNIRTLLSQNCWLHLIDNTADYHYRSWSNTARIRLSSFPENIGVNPAWNFGISECSTPYYLLLNDDCMIWNHVIRKCETIISDRNIGLVTFETIDNITGDQYRQFFINQDQPSRLVCLGPHETIGYSRIGWFIFGRTEEWVEIPKEIKILFGDDFIYQSIRKSGKKTVIDQANMVAHRIRNSLDKLYRPQALNRLYRAEKSQYHQIETLYGLENF